MTTWRMRVDHDCESDLLRTEAIKRMQQACKAYPGVKVKHEVKRIASTSQEMDCLDVSWLGFEMRVVACFSDQMVLLAAQLPDVLAGAYEQVQDRVWREVTDAVRVVGGRQAHLTLL